MGLEMRHHDCEADSLDIQSSLGLIQKYKFLEIYQESKALTYKLLNNYFSLTLKANIASTYLDEYTEATRFFLCSVLKKEKYLLFNQE